MSIDRTKYREGGERRWIVSEKRMKNVKKIINASHYRNGVGGIDFWAIIFESTGKDIMVASLFDDAGYCAVYSIKRLSAKNIAVSEGCEGNSWRGDVFEDELRPMLKKWLEKNENNIENE